MIGQNTFMTGRSSAPMLETALDGLPSLLTVDEAAALLRVNRKTLYEAVRLKAVPGVVRIGKSIRIGRDALQRWVTSHARR